MSQLLSVHQISQSFAGKQLFDNVGLGIFAGDRIGLVGPNGAGKSTLMKIIAKILKPDRGDVVYRKNLKIGYLEQSPEWKSDATIMNTLVADDQDYELLPRAYELMAKLGLNQFDENFPAQKLSGGWQKKLALARELILEPDLLLLDEPTNHLDVESIKWLEDFLSTSRFATMMITHDRLFLQRVVNKIFDLDPRNPNYLLNIQGDYLKYLETKELLLFQQNQRQNHLENQMRREKEWLHRGAKARQTKQQARIDNAAVLQDEINQLEQKNKKRNLDLDFSANERGPQKLIEAIDLQKSYNDRILFSQFTERITPKSRIALLGSNGCGKTTLIRCLLGEEAPDLGQVKIADQLKVAYFEQTRISLENEKSVLKNICPEGDFVDFKGQYIHVRTYLERFLFPRQQHDLPVGRLSGGEKARLRLAQLMLQPAQILVLDEPTNDLDVETLEVLEATLRDFPGAVLLVTHDRYFMDQVANEILAFHHLENKTVIEKFSGYLQWEEWFDLQVELEKEKKKEAELALKKAKSEQSKTDKKLSFKEKFELDNMEATILGMEEELSQAQKLMESSEIISDSKKIQELYEKIAHLQKTIEEKYNRWSLLQERNK